MFKKLVPGCTKSADSKDTFPVSRMLPALQDWIGSAAAYVTALRGAVSRDLT